MWADQCSPPQVTGRSLSLTHALCLSKCCVSSQMRGHEAVLATEYNVQLASASQRWWFGYNQDKVLPSGHVKTCCGATGKEGSRAGKTIQYPQRGDRIRSWAKFCCRSRTDHSWGLEVASSNAQWGTSQWQVAFSGVLFLYFNAQRLTRYTVILSRFL